MNVPKQYQTFWPRFWAGWVDALVWLPLVPVDSWIKTATTNSPISAAAWFIILTFAFEAYSVAMHAKYGQTLGKMVTGVKVLDLAGGKLSLRQAVIRDSLPIVLSVLTVADGLPRVLAGLEPDSAELTWLGELQVYSSAVWFAAELLTMLFSSKRRAVHDFLAHSVVIRLSAAGRTASEDLSGGLAHPAGADPAAYSEEPPFANASWRSVLIIVAAAAVAGIALIIYVWPNIDPHDPARTAEKTAIPSTSHPLAGFWKADTCADDFGLAIAPAGEGRYSISFCGPGGCFKPGSYRPNSPIIGDSDYRVRTNDWIEVNSKTGFQTYVRCHSR